MCFGGSKYILFVDWSNSGGGRGDGSGYVISGSLFTLVSKLESSGEESKEGVIFLFCCFCLFFISSFTESWSIFLGPKSSNSGLKDALNDAESGGVSVAICFDSI